MSDLTARQTRVIRTTADLVGYSALIGVGIALVLHQGLLLGLNVAVLAAWMLGGEDGLVALLEWQCRRLYPVDDPEDWEYSALMPPDALTRAFEQLEIDVHRRQQEAATLIIEQERYAAVQARMAACTHQRTSILEEAMGAYYEHFCADCGQSLGSTTFAQTKPLGLRGVRSRALARAAETHSHFYPC